MTVPKKYSYLEDHERRKEENRQVRYENMLFTASLKLYSLSLADPHDCSLSDLQSRASSAVEAAKILLKTLHFDSKKERGPHNG